MFLKFSKYFQQTWGENSQPYGNLSFLKQGLGVCPTVRYTLIFHELRSCMPGVGLMVRVAGFGSQGPEFKSHSAVELIPGGVNSACHLSEIGKMSASLLVSCVGVVTRPGLCPIAKETASAAPTPCTEYGPNLLLLLLHSLDQVT